MSHRRRSFLSFARARQIPGVFIALFIGLAIAGCRSPGHSETIKTAPAWIEQPQSLASGDSMVAVGSGRSRESAIDQAVMRLAQSIEVRLVAREASGTSARRLQTNSGVSDSINTTLDSTIRLFVDARLPGVTVQATHRDRASGMYFALVSLDRRRAADRLEDAALDAARRGRLAEIRAASIDNPWSRLATLRQAGEAAAEALDKLRARDAVALSSAPGAPLRDDLFALSRQVTKAIDETRSSLRVTVVASDAQSEALAAAVRLALAKLGVSTASGDAGALVRTGLRITPMRSFDPSRRAAAWSARVELVDLDRRAVIEQLERHGSVLSRTGARQEAQRRATDEIEKELPAFLERIFARGSFSRSRTARWSP